MTDRYEYETFEEALDAVETMTKVAEQDLGENVVVGYDVVCDLAESVALDSSPSVAYDLGLYYGIDERVAEIARRRTEAFAERALRTEENEIDRLTARIEASPTDRPELRDRREKARRRAEAVRSRIVDIRKTVSPEIRR